MSQVLGPDDRPIRTRHVLFARPTWGDAATAITTSTPPIAGAPTANLLTRQPSRVAGYDVSGINLQIQVVSPRAPLDVVCIPYANATPEATWDINIGDSSGSAIGAQAYDASGHGLHGTLEQGATYVQGKYGGGVNCDNPDGSTACQYVAAPTLDALAGDDLTFMVWVQPRRTNGANQIVLIESVLSATIEILTGGIVEVQNGIYGETVQAPEALTAGYWTHLCVRLTAGTQVDVFIDGALAVSATFTHGFANHGSGVLWFGGQGGAFGNGFDGVLDECRVYDHALTQAQIQAEMASEVTALPGQLALHYRLNAYQSGTRTFGVPPNLAAYDRRCAFHLLPYPMTNTTLQLTVSDPTNPSPLRIGRLFVGPCYQPSRNYDFGNTIGLTDDSKKTRTPGSQTMVQARPPVPYMAFTVRHLSKDEMLGDVYEYLRNVGTSQPLLVCLDPENDTNLQPQIIYGLLDDLQPITGPYFDLWETSFRVEALR